MLGNLRAIAAMRDPASPYHFPHFSLLFALEMTYNLVLAGLALWTLWSFLKEKRSVPKLMFWMFGMGVTVHACEYAFTRVFLENFEEVQNKALISFIETSITAAVWIPYFAKSKRVKNTFVK